MTLITALTLINVLHNTNHWMNTDHCTILITAKNTDHCTDKQFHDGSFSLCSITHTHSHTQDHQAFLAVFKHCACEPWHFASATHETDWPRVDWVSSGPFSPNSHTWTICCLVTFSIDLQGYTNTMTQSQVQRLLGESRPEATSLLDKSQLWLLLDKSQFWLNWICKTFFNEDKKLTDNVTVITILTQQKLRKWNQVWKSLFVFLQL